MSDTLAICSHICYFKFKYVIFFMLFSSLFIYIITLYNVCIRRKLSHQNHTVAILNIVRFYTLVLRKFVSINLL